MSEHKQYKVESVKVPKKWKERAYIDKDEYQKLYRKSVDNPDKFWGKEGKRLDWIKPYTRVKNASFAYPDVSIKWFEDGTLNVSANCIDRHLKKRGKQTAIIFEPDDPAQEAKHITYRELHKAVCRFANVLKANGVKRGDRVTIYLPMIPEAAYAMLACARIGAIHSVVFGGFSPDSLAGRIEDCKSRFLITADEGLRGGRKVPLKANADAALKKVGGVDKVLVVKHTGGQVPWTPGRDLWLEQELAKVGDDCPAEEMNAEDPLFILYTSGSTGQPKGVLHTSGGYLVFAAMTHQYVFDYHDGDIYWCTADVGWVTGHSYIVYGPLANGATTLIFEGVPSYPDASRFWQVVDKHKVDIFYTAPTAIRALMGLGDDYREEQQAKVAQAARQRRRADQSRSVGVVLSRGRRGALPDRRYLVADRNRRHSHHAAARRHQAQARLGDLAVFRRAAGDRRHRGEHSRGRGEPAIWSFSMPGPASMRTVYGDHKRFVDTYFSTYKGKYFTGDGCRRDADGYYWITGRVDDVINVAGHRMGTAEVESALVAHPKVSEAAVVGYPHDLKGQGIYCYVTLMSGQEWSDGLKTELRNWVRKEIGPIASPDLIQFAPGLPKTRSGKIMRRILRKIAEDDFGNLGDTSTLADPSVVTDLIEHRQNRKSV